MILVSLPEASLFFGALVITVLAAFASNANKTCALTSWITIITSAIFALFLRDGRSEYFYYTTTPQTLTILFCGLVASFLFFLHKNPKIARGESYIFLLTTMLGACIVINALSLLTLYVGIEIMSFSGYILVALNNTSDGTSEASLKYFTIGAISSCIMLFGISLIYGASTDSLLSIYPGTSYENGYISNSINANTVSIMTAGMLLFMCGVLFKIAAAPFHIWAPDVYTATNVPTLAAISTIPKLAGIAILINMLPRLSDQIILISDIFEKQQILIFTSAILSMVIGSIGAIRQTSILRIFAYSGIANIGYILAMISICTIPEYIPYILEFTTIYLLTNLTAFLYVTMFRSKTLFDGTINSLAGAHKAMPRTTIGFTIILLSLAGIPPLAGFFVKVKMFITLFSASWKNDLAPYFFQGNAQIILAVFAGLSSATSLYYYLRIIKIMYFDEGEMIKHEQSISKTIIIPTLLLTVCTALYILILPFNISHLFI